jgi:hypothetical protein
MWTWTDELVEVLRELGGEGHFSDMERLISQRNRKKFVASSVRNALEIHCPDKCFRAGLPIFYHKGNERSGIYGLIDFESVETLLPETLDVVDDFQENQLVEEFKQLKISLDKDDVEQKAVKIVTQALEKQGWTVESKELERIGYDLLCRKEEKTRFVEVKGRSVTYQSFFITKNELKVAKDYPSSFYLVIVTSVLSSHPSIYCYSGRRLLEEFDFEPLVYAAKLKEII